MESRQDVPRRRLLPQHWPGRERGMNHAAGNATLCHCSLGTKLRYFLDPETRARACHCRKHSAGSWPTGPPGSAWEAAGTAGLEAPRNWGCPWP